MHSILSNSRYTSALALALAVIACGSSQQPGPNHAAPTLNSTWPIDPAVGVALNTQLSAEFDRPMDAFTDATFTVKQGATPVAGTLTASPDGASVIFSPAANLAAGAVYTAMIAAGSKSSEGGAFAADHSWSFTTGDAADTTPPEVAATSPQASATGVAVNTRVTATFTKPMNAVTMTSSTFTVSQGAEKLPGNVVYGPGTTVSFTPGNPLAANVVFTASIGVAAKDLQGNALAAAFTWSFTTGTTAAKGPAAVGLGTARNYAVLAKTAISSVPSSAITGDIGLGPAAASYSTGFSLVADSTNVFSTSPQLSGKAFAANYAVPTPSNLTTAVSNMESAYTDAAGRPTPDFLELGTGNIGGKTLAPGLYKWTSTVTIPADVTISGGANDVWIFQTTGDLTMAAAQHVTLAGGALAKNVFWQVAGKVVFGANSHFEGIVLCKTEVTLQTGATMNGSILAQTQVALQQATVTQPAL